MFHMMRPEGALFIILLSCFLIAAGSLALVSGIVAIFARGIVRTVAAWVFGINAALFCLPFVAEKLSDFSSWVSEISSSREYDRKRTDLISAVEARDVGRVRRIIEKDKKKKKINEVKCGRTALSAACSLSCLVDEADEITGILLDGGADANLSPALDEKNYVRLNFGTLRESNPLALAIDRGRVGAVRMLVGHGAKTGSADGNPDEFKPVQFALYDMSYECAAVLIESGAEFSWYMSGVGDFVQGKTLLMELFERYDTKSNIGSKRKVLSLLLDRGIDAGARDENGRTALHYAVLGSSWEMTPAERGSLAGMVLESGADINAADNDGCTPLIYAVKVSRYPAGLVDAVGFLCAHGADVSATDNDGNSALAVFVEKYGKSYSSDETYGKIVALLTPRKNRAEKPAPAPSFPQEISAATPKTANAEILGHVALDDIADGW